MHSHTIQLNNLRRKHEALISRKNKLVSQNHGIYERYQYPVVTAEHVPLEWRFDLNPETNPMLLERIGVNATFNAGAIKWNEKYLVVVRVEGWDRKSYFAIAESPNGVDQFKFWERPITLPETSDPDINVYDMRLTAHEDGWVYGVFCSERKDPNASLGDTSSATASAGIARSQDLVHWERLSDLKTHSGQQRNVVLHPEFIDGKYGFYTRPQDGFIDTGSGGGIGFGLADNIHEAEVKEETIVDGKEYHTIYEVKNGQGPAPLRTESGWLHLAHGVRNTAAGLRYVLYLFLTDLNEVTKVIAKPGGFFIAPMCEERVGDVSNVAFSNGWIRDDDGKVFIYYGSSDTRLHVATTTESILLDYVLNTPADGLRSAASVSLINDLITRNLSIQSSCSDSRP